MPQNQPLAFALLLGGGLLLTSALTKSSVADVLQGKAGGVANQGDTLSSSLVGATGSAVSGGATGTVGKALDLAESLIGAPYNIAGHSNAIDETVAQVKQLGTDCSGEVSDLMGPNGLGIWSTSYATPSIAGAPGIAAGKGSEITLWNNPAPGAAGHVWIEFDLGNGVSRYFEEAGGVGSHEMTAAEAQSYLSTGLYKPYHPVGY